MGGNIIFVRHQQVNIITLIVTGSLKKIMVLRVYDQQNF